MTTTIEKKHKDASGGVGSIDGAAAMYHAMQQRRGNHKQRIMEQVFAAGMIDEFAPKYGKFVLVGPEGSEGEGEGSSTMADPDKADSGCVAVSRELWPEGMVLPDGEPNWWPVVEITKQPTDIEANRFSIDPENPEAIAHAIYKIKAAISIAFDQIGTEETGYVDPRDAHFSFDGQTFQVEIQPGVSIPFSDAAVDQAIQAHDDYMDVCQITFHVPDEIRIGKRTQDSRLDIS